MSDGSSVEYGISVIIPTYRSGTKLERCLKAVRRAIINTDIKTEIITVADGPDGNDGEIARKYSDKFEILEKHSGPAAARNRGAYLASGYVLFFLDSDVVPHSDTLEVIKKNYFLETSEGYIPDPEHKHDILVGLYDIEPVNTGTIPKLAALKKYIDFAPHKRRPFTTISGGIFAIPRFLFIETGGFNERYTSNTVEDYELGHRLAGRYNLMLCPKLRGGHHFPGSLKRIMYNYFRRSAGWMVLFGRKKRFDSGAAGGSGALGALIAFFITVLPFIGFIFPRGFVDPNYIIIITAQLTGCLIFLLTVRKYISAAFRFYGLRYALFIPFFIYLLYISAFLGAVLGLIRTIIGRVTERDKNSER